jgi:hypothetical protein
MGHRVAVATSEHPVAAHAVAECAGSLLEASPTGFEQVLCFVGTPFGGALVDIAGALAELLGASAIAGMESQTVLMGGRMASGTPALAVVAFAAGQASIGYTSGVEPDAGGPTQPGHEAETPGSRTLRILFADPFSHICGSPSPAGQLPADVSLVGCYLSGNPNGEAPRLFFDGTEHRRGALFVDIAAETASVHLVHGTDAIPDPVVVTSVMDGQIVALDDVPAAELLESRVRSMDIDIVDGVKQVGFTVPGDGRLVPARRTPAGLNTLLPLAPGTSLHPAVCSERAVADQVSAALQKCSGGTVLLFPAEDLPLGFPFDGYPEMAEQSAAQVVGPLATGVLWGSRGHHEVVMRSVLVIGMDPGSSPAAHPVGPGPADL